MSPSMALEAQGQICQNWFVELLPLSLGLLSSGLVHLGAGAVHQVLGPH